MEDIGEIIFGLQTRKVQSRTMEKALPCSSPNDMMWHSPTQKFTLRITKETKK